jgi:Fur family transcriptional regulator, peroxide stress response regulator
MKIITGMNTNKVYRETKQREIILKALSGSDDHPTAEEVYMAAKNRLPHISKGTVYRNLAVLLEMGKIGELNLDSKASRYEIKQMPHYHFRCENCGRVIDVHLPENKRLNRLAAAATGFKVKCHQTEFRGLCGECRKNI